MMIRVVVFNEFAGNIPYDILIVMRYFKLLTEREFEEIMNHPDTIETLQDCPNRYWVCSYIGMDTLAEVWGYSDWKSLEFRMDFRLLKLVKILNDINHPNKDIFRVLVVPKDLCLVIKEDNYGYEWVSECCQEWH